MSDSKVSIFFSYASADNTAWGDWIRTFHKKMKRQLGARLQGEVTLDEVHLYEDNGAISGDLTPELTWRIEASAAMVVFVHDKYLLSEACRSELEIFVSKHGQEGLDKKLFIVAMSKNAVQKLVNSDHWKDTVGQRQQLFVEFFDPQKPNQPLTIARQCEDGSMIIANDFQQELNKLLNGLQDCLKYRGRPNGQSRSVETPMASDAARRWCIGYCSPDLTDEVMRLQRDLGSHAGNEITLLAPSALTDAEIVEFREADDLILAFHEGASRHLDMQRQAWIDGGKSADRIHWLDLRNVKPRTPATHAQLKQLNQLVRNPTTMEQLIGMRPVRAGNSALIYIESNTHEVDHNVHLGRRLRKHWEDITIGCAPPPLSLVHLGLPIDELANFTSLAEADGFILLWGQKQPDSLVAQICEVENRVRSDPDLPPGIVAYLTPPHRPDTGLRPAYGWRVLRFAAEPIDDIDVVHDESGRLRAFLKEVYDRVERRRRSSHIAR